MPSLLRRALAPRPALPGWETLHDFADRWRAQPTAGVVTDLDGTALQERAGRSVVPRAIADGLRAVHRAHRPVIIDTLRFPMSVMREIAPDWLRHAGLPIPLVAMKGSQIGQITAAASGLLRFEETAAYPLQPEEIVEVLDGVDGLLRDGVDELRVFFYPRNWQVGEQIWTPRPAHLSEVLQKYPSASRVIAGPLATLRAQLLATEICMIFLLIDAPQDRLMAYQHTHRTSFFTHAGVDKRSGAEHLAARLGVDLACSVGAGDAPPDTFLSGVGLAVIVGNAELDYKGLEQTLRLPDPAAFGALLARLSTPDAKRR
ncbi:HAD family hydrolase [Caldimonas brevitalea]|uniref:Uncharacterized protein n=1 Tax=Caldimonas brevitalea TaxID=413882 RepID=A0A0G3BSQ4_9BURK|nr:hypothetical protein [Caldimonas brevitalea]AKJ30406.1 hypothetical protein AAW51_3715 [Caldimonas brevitalea]